jgi:hypothetical protein
MAQYRPFAVWNGTSSLPSGIDQSQNILIGVADQNYYNLGGFDWWAGPDESLGYVIACHNQTFTQPNPLNIPCGIGFLRSSALTDTSFLELFNHLMAKLSLTPVLNVNDAKTWLLANGYWTSYGEAEWTYGNLNSNPPQQGGTGSADWYFYSDEGAINTNPPILNGNLIITAQSQAGGTIETYDPNYDPNDASVFSKMILINLSNSAGTSLATEFNNLMSNGGTINLTQNGQVATYSTNQQGPFFVDPNGWFVIPASLQTTSTDGPFVYGDPITVTFGNSGGTGATWYWTAGEPWDSGEFSISANSTTNLELVTNIRVNKIAKDSSGNNATDISAFLYDLSVGDNIILKSTATPSSTSLYTITFLGDYGPSAIDIGVSYISGSGYMHVTLWEIEFI